MNINRSFFIIGISVLCLLFHFQANAQYQISKSVFGNGGTKVTNSNYQLNNTLGQALIGEIGSADYLKKIGFWYQRGIIPADSITWEMNLIITDAENGSGKLAFGQARTATDGLDISLGEAELPPTPPTGIFDVRFQLPSPISPPVYSLKDYRFDGNEAATWKLKFQPSTAGYPMKIRWNIAELPPGNFIMKDEITGNIVRVDMKSVDNVVVTNPAISSLLIEMTKVTWKSNLVVADAGNNNVTLTFGQASGAIDGLDPALGEVELPPPPPPGVIDARFELPGATIYSLKDFRSDADKTILWRFRFQPGGGGFPITLSWNPAELPNKSFVLKDEITGKIVNVDMKAQSSCTVTNPAITSLIIESTDMLIRIVNVVAGWNIISVPLKAVDMSVTTLFPGAASNAFQFNNGYVSVTTLSNGVGYWLKFGAAQTYQIQGQEVSPKQMSVNAGWNIIGPFETNVPIVQISSDPPGIIQSDFFKFDNGYKSVTILEFGKGYWVKVSQAGMLRVQPGSGLGKSTIADNEVDWSLAKMSALPGLRFEDSNGQSGMLYLTSIKNQNVYWEIPPIPPTGIFDVRFNTDCLVESLNDNELEILISSAQFPVKLSARNLGGMTLKVKDALGGSILNQTLSEQNEITIARSLNKILIKAAEPVALPSQYELSQNYPNPFNPTSIINYSLPEIGQVQISVYNILGKKVADLVDEMKPAGYHQVEIDARNYASGIYYYVMKSKGFSAIKKMAIVK